MNKPVFWTFEAERTFNNIIDYLHENWSQKEANGFVDLTKDVIKLISRHPEMFRKANLSGMHEALITKHQLLIYQIYDDKIVLFTFWDTRKNPLDKLI
jgi:plasmid stabilization system protein ParE